MKLMGITENPGEILGLLKYNEYWKYNDWCYLYDAQNLKWCRWFGAPIDIIVLQELDKGRNKFWSDKMAEIRLLNVLSNWKWNGWYRGVCNLCQIYDSCNFYNLIDLNKNYCSHCTELIKECISQKI